MRACLARGVLDDWLGPQRREQAGQTERALVPNWTESFGPKAIETT